MAAEGLIRCVLDLSLSLSDADIERRPYHRNCGCALHKSRGVGVCHKGLNQKKKISYPMRRAWSESCLVMAGSSAASSPSSSPSPSPSPSPANMVLGMGRHHLELCEEEENGV